MQAYHFVGHPAPVLHQVHGQDDIELERGLRRRFLQDACHTDGLARRRDQLLAYRMLGPEYPQGGLWCQQGFVGLQLQAAFLAAVRHQVEEQAVHHYGVYRITIVVLRHKVIVKHHKPAERLHCRMIQRIAVIGVVVPVPALAQRPSRFSFLENGCQEGPVGFGHKMIDGALLVDVAHQHKDTTQAQGQSQHIDGGVGPEAQDGTDG